MFFHTTKIKKSYGKKVLETHSIPRRNTSNLPIFTFYLLTHFSFLRSFFVFDEMACFIACVYSVADRILSHLFM